MARPPTVFPPADLGLLLGNGYVSHRVFGIPKFGIINVHGERLPEYQDAQSVIWTIYYLETTAGLTIHQIDRTIDTGKILYREEYPIVHSAFYRMVRNNNGIFTEEVNGRIRRSHCQRLLSVSFKRGRTMG